LAPGAVETAVAATLIEMAIESTGEGGAGSETGTLSSTPTYEGTSLTPSTEATGNPGSTSEQTPPYPSPSTSTRTPGTYPSPAQTHTRTSTPTGTSTLTPTSPTATYTPSPSSTSTYTATMVPMATYTQDPCGGSSASNFSVNGQEVRWSLFNGGTGVVEIFKIYINWPSENDELTKIELGGDAIWDKKDKSPPTLIAGGWKSGVSRSIGPGISKTLRFFFDKEAKPSGYAMKVTFDNGCEVSWP